MKKIVCDVCGKEICEPEIRIGTSNGESFMLPREFTDVNGHRVDVCSRCIYEDLGGYYA